MEKLGIQLPVLIAQIINFAILVWALNKLLYKPILKMLQKRKSAIAESVKQVEEIKEEQLKHEQKKKDILKETQEEAAVIMANAKKDAKKAKADIIKQGKEEIAALKKKMQKDLQDKYEKMGKSLSEETVEIAAKMVERLLGEVLSKEQQTSLLKKQLKKIHTSLK